MDQNLDLLLHVKKVFELSKKSSITLDKQILKHRSIEKKIIDSLEKIKSKIDKNFEILKIHAVFSDMAKKYKIHLEDLPRQCTPDFFHSLIKEIDSSFEKYKVMSEKIEKKEDFLASIHLPEMHILEEYNKDQLILWTNKNEKYLKTKHDLLNEHSVLLEFLLSTSEPLKNKILILDDLDKYPKNLLLFFNKYYLEITADRVTNSPEQSQKSSDQKNDEPSFKIGIFKQASLQKDGEDCYKHEHAHTI